MFESTWRIKCVVMAASTLVASSAATAARAEPHVAAELGRPAIRIAAASKATAVAYTIVDVGTPSASYSSSTPLGFDNDGRIYGTANRKAKSVPQTFYVDSSCLVWTGSQFVDLAPSLTISPCRPFAIGSAASAGGPFTVVGTFKDIHHSNYADETNAFFGECYAGERAIRAVLRSLSRFAVRG